MKMDDQLFDIVRYLS